MLRVVSSSISQCGVSTASFRIRLSLQVDLLIDHGALSEAEVKRRVLDEHFTLWEPLPLALQKTPEGELKRLGPLPKKKGWRDL